MRAARPRGPGSRPGPALDRPSHPCNDATEADRRRSGRPGPPPGAAAGGTDRDTSGRAHRQMRGSDRYVIISADCHGGADVAQYRPYLPSRYHQSVRRVGPGLPGAPRGPARRRGPQQLGQRPPPGRPRGRRHRGRGRSTPTRSRPSIPSTRSRCRCPGRPRVTSRPAGPACGPTTGGWPTSAPPPRGAGPASPRSCCTTSTPRWPRSSGRPRRRWAAGSCCPAPRRARASSRCTRRATSRSGRPARRPDSRSTTTAAVPCRPWATSRSSRWCSCSRSPGGPTGPCGTSSSAG